MSTTDAVAAAGEVDIAALFAPVADANEHQAEGTDSSREAKKTPLWDAYEAKKAAGKWVGGAEYQAAYEEMQAAIRPAAIRQVKADPQQSFQRHVERAVYQLRVREEAKAQYAAEKAASDFGALPALKTLTDALNEPDEDEKWRIDGLLPDGGNATLVAPEKAGKTTLVGNLVRSLVDGAPFLGKHPVTPVDGRVAVLNYEVTSRMFTRWLADMNIHNTDRVTALHLRGHRLPLLTEQGMKWLADQLRAADVKVMIVDPFGAAFRSAGGMNENDNSEVGRFLSALDVVKEQAGVRELVMPVHAKREMAEGAERARAASVLADWPDAIWTLAVDKNKHRYLSARGRDVDQPEAQLAFDKDTRALTVAGGSRRAAKKDDGQRAVLAYVTAHPGLSGRALEAALVPDSISKGGLNTALHALVDDGLIRTEPGAKNATLHYASDVPCSI